MSGPARPVSSLRSFSNSLMFFYFKRYCQLYSEPAQDLMRVHTHQGVRCTARYCASHVIVRLARVIIILGGKDRH